MILVFVFCILFFCVLPLLVERAAAAAFGACSRLNWRCRWSLRDKGDDNRAKSCWSSLFDEAKSNFKSQARKFKKEKEKKRKSVKLVKCHFRQLVAINYSFDICFVLLFCQKKQSICFLKLFKSNLFERNFFFDFILKILKRAIWLKTIDWNTLFYFSFFLLIRRWKVSV